MKSEKSVEQSELPVHQYKLSEFAQKVFSETEVKKGIKIQDIVLYDYYMSFKYKVNSLDKLIISKTNPEGLVDYRSVIPKTGEVLK